MENVMVSPGDMAELQTANFVASPSWGPTPYCPAVATVVVPTGFPATDATMIEPAGAFEPSTL